MNLEKLKASLPGRVAAKFMADQAQTWSVVIAWQALLSMFPIILALAAVLGLLLGMAGLRTDHLVDGVLSGIPDAGARADIAAAIAQVKSKSGLFAVIGVVGLFVSGAALFGAMEQAFAVVFRCDQRGFLRQKIVGFLMILVFAVLAGAAVASSAVLPLLTSLPLPFSFSSGPGALVAQIGLGVVVGVLLFGIIYFVVPTRGMPLQAVWPGAVLAGVLFELVTLIFPMYLELNAGINAYGQTFGLFFILMTYFFFLGLITMAGAELNSVLAGVVEGGGARLAGGARHGRAWGRPPQGAGIMKPHGGHPPEGSGVRRKQMERSGFAAGLVIGSLGGLALGYLLYRNGHHGIDTSPGTSIDLTPAIELKDPGSNPRGSEPVEAPPG